MPGPVRDIFEEEDLSDYESDEGGGGGSFNYDRSVPFKITPAHMAEVRRWYDDLTVRAKNWSHSDFGAYVATVASATGLPLSSLTLMPGALLQDFEPFSFDVGTRPPRRKRMKTEDLLDAEVGFSDDDDDFASDSGDSGGQPSVFPAPEPLFSPPIVDPRVKQEPMSTTTATPVVVKAMPPPQQTPVNLLTPAQVNQQRSASLLVDPMVSPFAPTASADPSVPPRAEASVPSAPTPMAMGNGRAKIGGAPNRHARQRDLATDVYAGYFADYAEAAERNPEIQRRMQLHHQFRTDVSVLNLLGNPLFQRDPARVLKTPHLQGWEATAMMRIKQSSYGSHLRQAQPEHFYHDIDARTAFANLVGLCVREAESSKGTQLSQAYPMTLPAIRAMVFACTSCVWAGSRNSYLVRDWERYQTVQHQANGTHYIPRELTAAPRFSQSVGKRPRGRGALTSVFF